MCLLLNFRLRAANKQYGELVGSTSVGLTNYNLLNGDRKIMITRHIKLCNELKQVMEYNKHSRYNVMTLMGVTYNTLSRILEKPKGWVMQVATKDKIKEYIRAYGADNTPIQKEELTVIRASDVIPQPKKDYNELHDFKIKSMLKDTFIESYNRLLNPLGYQVKISIEPLAI